MGEEATRATVEYEVWRTHLNGGSDVRIGGGRSREGGLELFKECEADKADGYPDAPVDFFLIRASTKRECVVTTAAQVGPQRGDEGTEGA